VTISGTVGAAMEGAAFGVPAMAVSLEVDASLHVHYDDSVDFSAAMYFTHHFAEKWIMSTPLPDVDLLKLEIPGAATPDTPWRIARLERQTYYASSAPKRQRLQDEGPFGYQKVYRRELSEGETDASLLHDGVVAVTPLTLDMTSRVDRGLLERMLDGKKSRKAVSAKPGD
jgi:5'-nucleotidase